MVSRQDFREINQATRDLQIALDEMRELWEAQQDDAITVDAAAYADAQMRLKEALVTVWETADDAVDRSGEYEPDSEDATPVALPDPALDRTDTARGMPDTPGGG